MDHSRSAAPSRDDLKLPRSLRGSTPRRITAACAAVVLLGLARWTAPAAPPAAPAGAEAGARAAASAEASAPAPAAARDPRDTREGQLVLNEFMADNDGFHFDELGDDDDWIEIHNLGPTPVNLEGKFLTDSLPATRMWEFPDTTIPVGGYLIVWADGEPAEGPLHTTFKLERSGEQLGLFDYLGVGNGPIDTLTFGLQATNISYGRYPNGTGPFTYMENPSPAAANQPHQINLPPFIAGTEHVPGGPTSQDVVTVRARIADDAGVGQAKVFYNPGTGFVQLPLFDDGQHDDEGAGDQLWGAQIQPYPDGTAVLYYIWARDDFGGVSLDPPGAPQHTHLYVVRDLPPPLFINEFMALNGTTIADEFGEYEDWVELYNNGDEAVGLLGLYLTDNLGNPDKFDLPDVSIDPGDFLIIWCDEDGSQGPLHANFKLSSTNGEEIGLFRETPQGLVPVDSVTFGPQTVDVSQGRFPDGGAEWRFFQNATPGASNSGAAVDDPQDPLRGFALQAWPNPFGAWTALSFELAEPAEVELTVIDAAGRAVYVRARRDAAAGPQRFVWRGSDAAGTPLPGGIYHCRVRAGAGTRSAKVLLVR